MLTITKKPMVEITEVTQPCFLPAVGDICDPCRQLGTYFPKIKAPTLKENSVIEALAKAFLQVDDDLLKKICGFCLTWNTDNCECLLAFGASIGMPTSYLTIDATNCMRFGYNETVNKCCAPEQVPLVTPEGFTGWTIPQAEYNELGCNVDSLQVLSYSDDQTGLSASTGTLNWTDSQASIDSFLMQNSQQYPESVEGDLLIGIYNNRPVLFIKDDSQLDKSLLFFLLQCEGGGSFAFKTFTEQVQPVVSTELICTKQVFAYCQQLCNVCNYHYLDVCNNADDFEFYKKIVKFKSMWFHKAPTRKNITDALVDWFGDTAHVVDARYPNVFWSLGRSPTAEELAIMPFVYSMMPLYDGINLIFTEEL